MTMHVVLGDGDMKAGELIAALDELWKADTENDQDFWFTLVGKSNPTETDLDMLDWLNREEVFYIVVTDDEDSMHESYKPAQTFKAKGLAKKLRSLMESEPRGGESVNIMALYCSDDTDAEEDRWLNDICKALADEGHPIIALNDGMVEVDYESVEEHPEAEDVPDDQEQAEAVDQPDIEEVERLAEAAETREDTAPTGHTRAELEEMELPQLKEIAASLDLVLPPRTRSGTYVDKIMGSTAESPAKVTQVAVDDDDEITAVPAGVDFDIEEVVAEVTDRVFKRLREALD